MMTDDFIFSTFIYTVIAYKHKLCFFLLSALAVRLNISPVPQTQSRRLCLPPLTAVCSLKFICRLDRCRFCTVPYPPSCRRPGGWSLPAHR